MENTQVKNKPKRVNELKGLEKVELKTVCRSCGKPHFVEPDAEQDNIKTFINKWRELAAWLINSKCTYCASPVTMELFVNNKTVTEIWEYINSEVMEDIPEMKTPETKSEAIKYFVNECKNCLDYRQEYIENAFNPERMDLIETYSPLACSVTKSQFTFYYKDKLPTFFDITNYEYEKLFKAFRKGVKVEARIQTK